MTVQELIDELSKYKEEHGNLPVHAWGYDMSFDIKEVFLYNTVVSNPMRYHYLVLSE